MDCRHDVIGLTDVVYVNKNIDQHLKKLSHGYWVAGRMQKAVGLGTTRICEEVHPFRALTTGDLGLFNCKGMTPKHPFAIKRGQVGGQGDIKTN